MPEVKSVFDGLFGIAGLILWAITYLRIFKKNQISLPKSREIRKNRLKRLTLFILGVIAWLSISYALMAPRLPLGISNDKKKVNDIFFVIDISRSMLANDFKPNRLEVAKKKIEEFINLRSRDRIGLVIFSERAFTLLPLTTDHELIRKMVKKISVGILGGGTNIGDALGLAVARGALSLADNKIIVLLTDGVSNIGNMTPIQAAREAKNQGMRVYTIGVGGSESAKIPAGRGIFGTNYVTIPGGSIDLKTLKEIADITGGMTYTAGNPDALKNVFNKIDEIERTEIDISSKMLYKELYYEYFFFGVVLLLMVELLRRYFLKEAL